MAEYLAPGVFVEEVSFRAKSIEGVSTSTTGYAGLARFGPVHSPSAATETTPRLVTNYTEFERIYGGLDQLQVFDPVVGGPVDRECYLAHAVRAFFQNGGRRLYVSRVFVPNNAATDTGVATTAAIGVGTGGTSSARWRARWPGRDGNVLVQVIPVRSKNVVFDAGGGTAQLRRVRRGSVVEVTTGTPAADDAPLTRTTLAVVDIDANGVQTLIGPTGNVPFTLATTVRLVELRVRVAVNVERTDVYDALSTFPQQLRYIGRILNRDDPEDENALVWLDWTPPTSVVDFWPADLMVALTAAAAGTRLTGGNDGTLPTAADLAGRAADPDDVTQPATGLTALGEIDDIAIVALPDGGTFDDRAQSEAAADALIEHAQALRYRIAVIDGPRGASLTEIRRFRGRLDSKYAALYHPWIEVFDPNTRAAMGAPPRRLLLPPSGFVTGIYARSDIERGVHKAPANEVVLGLTRFELNINRGRQEVLNPEGINALRFFEGRGNRVWGARTVSSDPEWKYVNVRRLFIYLEHSIDRSTQWAVFEPNNERLWANVRSMVEDFLLVLWRDGALLGEKPEDAYFVRCDRTTMTQNDLDNGRLICLVGVAPVKPAEFVIFRVGQWTADAKRP